MQMLMLIMQWLNRDLSVDIYVLRDGRAREGQLGS